MFTLFRKEINGFLNSLIGYIVMIVFLLMTGLFLWVFPLEFNLLDYGFAGLDGLFIIAPCFQVYYHRSACRNSGRR